MIPVQPPKRRKAKQETYSSYVYKVLKQVHPDTGISMNAMQVMCDYNIDIFKRIARCASELVAVSGRSTLSSREIQTATRLCIPGKTAEGTRCWCSPRYLLN